MCNLYHVSPKGDAERFIGQYGYQIDLPEPGKVHVGPFDTGVYIRPDGDDLRGYRGRWGLIRPGMPRAEIATQKNLTNNARFETIGTKPTGGDERPEPPPEQPPLF